MKKLSAQSEMTKRNRLVAAANPGKKEGKMERKNRK
jgi:hypothetical protein